MISCDQCNSLCCQYFCFEIDEPDDFEEFEDIRWYLCHEDVSVHIDEDETWYIQIENPCKMLGGEHRCKIYEDRPLICRNYDLDSCEATHDDYGYLEEFRTPEELEAYARKTLGKKTYERELVKYRAKAEGVTSREMRKQLRARLVIDHDAKKEPSGPKGETP